MNVLEYSSYAMNSCYNLHETVTTTLRSQHIWARTHERNSEELMELL